jgi:hypothetical protein
MNRTDILSELVLSRRIRLALEGTVSDPARPLRPLEYVRPSKRTTRTAERQEAIDALEHGAMATRFE